MQEYIIHSFKKISDNSIWIRQETGQNSGGYVYNNQVKRLNDFICDGEFIIYSVIKQISENNRPIFTIGDKININIIQHFEVPIIKSIKIELSNVVLFIDIATPNHRVLLQNATKYIEPMAIKAPVKKVTKKVGAVEVSEENKEFTAIVKQIESKLKPVRLEKTLKKRKETLEEFLIKFFKVYNNEKSTIFVDTLEVQCSTNRRRSLGDIYMILKYYYPDVTLNEVLNLLYNVLPVKMNPGFRTSKCGEIRKRVWYFDADDNNGVFNEGLDDEYGNRYSWYKERISK